MLTLSSPLKTILREIRKLLSNNTSVYLSITRFCFCSQCTWQYLEWMNTYVSCPTPCTGTPKKRMHSLKTGGAAKAYPVLWAYLKKQKQRGDKKCRSCQCPVFISTSFQLRWKRKLSADKRDADEMPSHPQGCELCWYAAHDRNFGTGTSIQILLMITSSSDSMSSPLSGDRPVHAAGTGVCTLVSWSDC